MNKKLLVIFSAFFIFHSAFSTASAQVVCIFCYDQNDSISSGVNNLLLNGGFESGCINGSFCPPSSYYTCDIPNWTCTGGGTSTYAQIFDINGAFYGGFLSMVAEGAQSLYMGNFYAQACSAVANDTSCLVDSFCTVTGVPPGYPVNPDATYGGATGLSIEQTVTGLITGSTYVLEFWAGGEYDGFGLDGIFAVDVGFGNIFLRDKETNVGSIGTRYIIEFNAVSSTHTIKFTNWGHICSDCTELVLDDVRLYSLAELSPSVPPCAGALPNSLFTAPNHICPGTCINFTNLSTGANSYQWSFPGGSPSSSTDINPQNICYEASGQYPVTLVSSNGIATDTLTLNLYITVYPPATAPTFSQNGDTLFATQGYTSYQWFFGGDTIQGATNYFYVAPVSGNYNLTVYDTNGCGVGAGILNVVASVQSGIGSSELEVSVFPNPNSGEFVVRSSQTGVKEITIVNVLGEIVYRTTINRKQETINCKLQQGIYLLKMACGKNIITRKIAVR